MDDEAEAGAPSASPRELMAGAGALILAAGGHGPCRAAGAAGADPVAAHALPIRSIEPDDEDYEDLKAFGDDVGDARIVQLGERSHGAGVDFKAKVRLIKFLHTRLGFDVLVWESGLHGMRGVNAGFRAGLDPVAAAQRGVFTIWSATAEVRPLFDYAKASRGARGPWRWRASIASSRRGAPARRWPRRLTRSASLRCGQMPGARFRPKAGVAIAGARQRAPPGPPLRTFLRWSCFELIGDDSSLLASIRLGPFKSKSLPAAGRSLCPGTPPPTVAGGGGGGVRSLQTSFFLTWS